MRYEYMSDAYKIIVLSWCIVNCFYIKEYKTITPLKYYKHDGWVYVNV